MDAGLFRDEMNVVFLCRSAGEEQWRGILKSGATTIHL